MNIDNVLNAKNFSEFKAATGMGWFDFQRLLGNVLGIGPSFEEWTSETMSIVNHDWLPAEGQSILVLKPQSEQAVARAAGLWLTGVEKMILYFDESVIINGFFRAGPHDPIKFPGIKFSIRRRRILEAMEKEGFLHKVV